MLWDISPERGSKPTKAKRMTTEKPTRRRVGKSSRKETGKSDFEAVGEPGKSGKTRTKAGPRSAKRKPVRKKKSAGKGKLQAAKKAVKPNSESSGPARQGHAAGKKAGPAAVTLTPEPTPAAQTDTAKSVQPSNNSFTNTSQDYTERMENISLKWGAQLPKVGFGFWKVEQDQTAQVCYDAISTGYRHLDCACDYGNEKEVGRGIAKAISDGLCDRDDLWVTSKLWNTYHAAEHVRPACEKTLQDLGLDYLDLYLIHFPIAQRFVPFEKNYPPGWFFDPAAPNPVIEEARVPLSETWQAMEELAKSGLVGNIGICNVGTSQLRDLICHASIRPAVLQVESHPYLTQEKLLRYCQQERIAYTAFSPLGAQSYFSLGMASPSEAVLQNPVVTDIAATTGRTAAQVLLRWGVQRGTAVIPKTSSADRMAENINIFDFELSDEQMTAISSLDQGRRFNDPGDFGESAFNTFLPIYE